MIGTTRGWLLLLPLLALTACGIGSINPAFEPDSARFDARLLGAWQGSDDDGTAVVLRSRDGYLIDYTDDDNRSGRFRAHLGLLDGRTVLDIQPDDRALPAMSDAYTGLLLPLHTVLFVDSIGDIVRLRAVKPDSLTSFLRREPQAVAHLHSENLTVLTAPTPELGRFLAGFARRPGALDDPMIWVRQTRAASR